MTGWKSKLGGATLMQPHCSTLTGMVLTGVSGGSEPREHCGPWQGFGAGVDCFAGIEP